MEVEPERKYNAHYLKYRETILARAKVYQKEKTIRQREEKRKQIALDYIKEKLNS
jgi:hypothetical protein